MRILRSIVTAKAEINVLSYAAAFVSMVAFYNTTGILRALCSMYMSAAATFALSRGAQRFIFFLRNPEEDTVSELPKTILMIVNVACLYYCVFQMIEDIFA